MDTACAVVVDFLFDSLECATWIRASFHTPHPTGFLTPCQGVDKAEGPGPCATNPRPSAYVGSYRCLSAVCATNCAARICS